MSVSHSECFAKVKNDDGRIGYLSLVFKSSLTYLCIICHESCCFLFWFLFSRFHRRSPKDYHIIGDLNGHYRIQEDIRESYFDGKTFPTVTELIQYYKTSSDDGMFLIIYNNLCFIPFSIVRKYFAHITFFSNQLQ